MSNIHSHAMLVNLNISVWTARKMDRKASAEIKQAHQLQTNSGAYYKSIVEGGDLDLIKQKAGQIRAEHYRRTLPWLDDGPRVLSNQGYFDYMQVMSKLIDEFDALVESFMQTYPHLRQEAQRLLGSLFDESDYPSLTSLHHKFGVKLAVTPIPKGDDFRCDIGDAELQRVRAEIEAASTAAMQQSIRDAYDRVVKVLDSYIDRLAQPDTVFRDSLVEKARDLADVLPSLNFTNDPKLTEVHQRLLAELCKYDPAALRSSETARRDAYETAAAMRKDLMDFFGGAV